MPRRVEAAPRAARVLAVLGGVALALTLPKPGLCPLGWLGLAPLLYAVGRRPPREAFRLGWLAGAAYHGVALYWIYSTCRFAQVPLPVCALAWLTLAAFQGAAWGVAALAGRWAVAALPRWARAFGWAVVWTAVAAACERWTPRLPGDLLQYTQWRFLPLLQIASLGGPHALGLLVAWWNASLAQLASDWNGDRRPAARSLAAAAAAIAGALGFGLWSMAQRPAKTTDVVRVEILQPNIDQYHKWDRAWEQRIIETFEELLAAHRDAKPDMVVWPESALPYWVPVGTAPTEPAAWARLQGATHVVGIVTGEGWRHFNSEVVVAPDGRVTGVYHKRERVPFGEYVPFGALLKPLIGKLNEIGFISKGADEQPLLETPAGRAAGTICYEAVFPRWSRRDAARGARLIVNVTNDGWYKDTWGPYQHFKTNVYRAIENRVGVVRSGNTGISAVIDPWGVETAELPLNTRGVLEAELPRADAFPARSFYARHGDWLAFLCMAAALSLGAYAALGARRYSTATSTSL